MAVNKAPAKGTAKRQVKKPARAKAQPKAKKTAKKPRASTGKHAGGRPTEYDPEWVEKLPGMFRQGQSVLEVAVALNISKSAYYVYEAEHPEFLDASTRGKEISQAWWEKQGRVNLFDTETYNAKTKTSTRKSFNSSLWSKNVSCRFRKDWTDKTELEHSGSVGAGVLKVPSTLSPDDWAAAAAAQQTALMAGASHD